MSIDFLRGLPLFDGLPEEDLQRMFDLAEPAELMGGEVLIREGAQDDSLYVVLEGRLEISKRSGDRDVVIAVRGAGEVMGEMALLSEAPRSATVTALGPARLLRLDKETFQAFLRANPEAAVAILHTVTERLHNTQSMLRHHEKLSSLGTLAAGLAHEINNPAGAIQRAAAQLSDLMLSLTESGQQVGRLAAELGQREELDRLRAGLAQARGEALDSLARSDLEAELEAWLEAAGVEEAWRLAGPLVDGGWTPQSLDPAQSAFNGPELETVMEWLAQSSEALALTAEVGHASGRIASIVKSVKDYSYLDQAPEQVIDIHQGLEDTLVILRHKLGDGIVVRKQFAPDLPRLEGFGSELTQVWTNLVDNAIDAMEGKGTLTIETESRADAVEVRVCDDGPGIPAESQDRVFDPFYTTKPPGVGTGLGLHLVYNIVVQRHQGSVEVESRPGRTCFTVTLPVSG